MGYSYDPNKAKQLLADAGYANGITITFTYTENTNQDTVLALQDMLAESNITLELNKVSYNQVGAIIFATGWNGLLISFTMPGKTVDPGFTAGMYITQGGWVSLAKPADIAALINQAATEPDNAKRTALYQQISKAMTDQCVFPYLYYTGGYTSILPWVKGYTIGQFKEYYAWTYAYIEED
jgi:peptide/nickel transport system substrate-binding protein